MYGYTHSRFRQDKTWLHIEAIRGALKLLEAEAGKVFLSNRTVLNVVVLLDIAEREEWDGHRPLNSIFMLNGKNFEEPVDTSPDRDRSKEGTLHELRKLLEDELTSSDDDDCEITFRPKVSRVSELVLGAIKWYDEILVHRFVPEVAAAG